MKVLVTYSVFCPDNYQGGSGKTVEGSYLVSVPDDVVASSIDAHAYNETYSHLKKFIPFSDHQDFKVHVIQMLIY